MAQRRLTHCDYCGTKLKGKQRRFCSNSCRVMSNRIKRTGGSKSSRVAREPLPEPLPTGPTKVVVADANPVVESVAAAAATGDPVRTLVALRQRLAAEVDAVDHPKELAVLASKLMETTIRGQKCTKNCCAGCVRKQPSKPMAQAHAPLPYRPAQLAQSGRAHRHASSNRRPSTTKLSTPWGAKRIFPAMPTP